MHVLVTATHYRASTASKLLRSATATAVTPASTVLLLDDGYLSSTVLYHCNSTIKDMVLYSKTKKMILRVQFYWNFCGQLVEFLCF